MQKILFLLIAGFAGFHAWAGQKPARNRELTEIIAWLKNADGYAYEVNTVSMMLYDSVQKQQENITIYTSGKDHIRYISSDQDVSFMNNNGFFKVFITKKKGVYKQFTSDSMARLAFAAVDVSNAAKLADSLLFDHAMISSRREVNGLLHYRLSYDPGYMIKGLELVFDNRKKELVSVSYSLERPLASARGKEGLTRQRIVMSHYRHEAPEALKKIVSGSSDLKAFMLATYTDYQIHSL